MKKLFLILKFSFLVSAVVLISSCSDINVSPECSSTEVCILSGSVSSDFSSRSAYPSGLNSSNYVYSVKAYKEIETDAVSAEMNGSSFSVSLTYGKWKIKAEVLDQGTVLFSKVQTVTLDSAAASISINGLSIVSGVKTGSVNLVFNKDVDSNAHMVIARWKAGGNEYSETVALPGLFYMTGDSNSFAQNGKVPSGEYKVNFYVKNNNGAVISIFVEKINVLPGKMTSKFTNVGSQYISASGNIQLTKECENISTKTTFYVSSSGSDVGTGSKISPLNSIQTAVDIIEAINDESTTYCVTLMDDITADADSGKEVSGYGKSFVTVNPSKNLKIMFTSDSLLVASKISASEAGQRAFYFGEKANATIENLEIADFNISGFNGAGICNNGGNVSLSGSVFLTGNQCSSANGSGGMGGAIYNSGTLRISGTSYISANSASIYGGALCIVKGNVEINSSVISICENSCDGKGNQIAVISSEGNSELNILDGSVYESSTDSSATIYVSDYIQGNSRNTSSIKLGTDICIQGLIWLERNDFNGTVYNNCIELVNNYSQNVNSNITLIFSENDKAIYETGGNVLSCSGSGIISANRTNFKLNQDSSGNSYFINESGILEKGPETVAALSKDASGRYCIGNRKELEFVRDKINADAEIETGQAASSASYILTDDIDMVNIPWDGMGSSSLTPFCGSFDGNNHKILNLNLNDVSNSGLFKFVNGAEIKNIKEITGNSSLTKSTIGVLAAVCSGGNIVFENIVVNVNIETTNANASGFTAELNTTGTTLTIINCINKGNITALSNAGGFIGNIYSSDLNKVNIYNCANLGNISVTTTVGGAGGFVGKVSTANITMVNNYNKGLISGQEMEKTKNGSTITVYNEGNMFGVSSVNLESNSTTINYFYYYENCCRKIIGDNQDYGYHITVSEGVSIKNVLSTHNFESACTINGTSYSSLLNVLNCNYVLNLIKEKSLIEAKKWKLENNHYIFAE